MSIVMWCLYSYVIRSLFVVLERALSLITLNISLFCERKMSIVWMDNFCYFLLFFFFSVRFFEWSYFGFWHRFRKPSQVSRTDVCFVCGILWFWTLRPRPQGLKSQNCTDIRIVHDQHRQGQLTYWCPKPVVLLTRPSSSFYVLAPSN